MFKFISRNSKIIQQNAISPITTSRNSPEKPPYAGFELIYKFPYIKGISLINRMKLYHTVLASATTIPAFCLQFTTDFITNNDVIFISGLAVAGLVPLYGFGYFANRLIGGVYFNSKENELVLAYSDFWGRRKDLKVHGDDIYRLADMPRGFLDPLYNKVQFYSNEKNYLKICLKYGVLERRSFYKALGVV